MKKGILIYILAILFVFVPVLAVEVDGPVPILPNDNKIEKKYPKFWLNFGVGLLALNINFTFQIGKKLFSLRYAAMGAIDDYSVSDISVMVGYPLENRSVLFSGGVGIGLISGTFSQGGDTKTIFNIPTEVQFFFRFSRSFGIGLYTFINFNREKTLGNICLCIQIGIRIRK
jgi:hypothetical protein